MAAPSALLASMLATALMTGKHVCPLTRPAYCIPYPCGSSMRSAPVPVPVPVPVASPPTAPHCGSAQATRPISTIPAHAGSYGIGALGAGPALRFRPSYALRVKYSIGLAPHRGIAQSTPLYNIQTASLGPPVYMYAHGTDETHTYFVRSKVSLRAANSAL